MCGLSCPQVKATYPILPFSSLNELLFISSSRSPPTMPGLSPGWGTSHSLAHFLSTLWLANLGKHFQGTEVPSVMSKQRIKERSDNGAVYSTGVYYGSDGPACLHLFPESHATWAGLLTLFWMWKERSRLWRARLLGPRVVVAAWIRGKGARLKPNSGGRAGQRGWAGQNSRFLSNTQFNSKPVFLVPGRFLACNSVIYRWICSGELQVCKQQLL